MVYLVYAAPSEATCTKLMKHISSVMMQLCSGDIETNPGPIEDERLHDELNRAVSVCHANVNGLHEDEMNYIQANFIGKHDIICITETHLKPSSPNDLSLIGYQKLFRRDRIEGTWGGVLVWVSDSLLATRRTDLETGDIESIWLECVAGNKKFLYCGVYRPPSSPVAFWETLQVNLDNAKTFLGCNILLSGDLNADAVTNPSHHTHMLTLANNNHLKIHVDKPTRITPRSKSILDQFISTPPDLVKNVDVLTPVTTSDHSVIVCDLSFKTHTPKSYKRKVWYYDKADFDGFREALMYTDWSNCFLSADPDTMCETWTRQFLKICAEFIPNNVVTIRQNDKPFFNKHLRRKKRSLERVHRKARRSGEESDWADYRRLRNEYISNLREAKANYMDDLENILNESSSLNPKKWWRISKQMLGINDSYGYPVLDAGGRAESNAQVKASMFNNYFLSQSSLNINDHICIEEDDILMNMGLNNISVTKDDVTDLINCIDVTKACGPDGISPRMIREAGSSISEPLNKIFNECLKTGKMPRMWKQAHVIPIYKKGSRNLVDNYRPVSLLSCIGKLFERIVFKYLFNYLRDNDILSRFQSGFMPGDSTVNQLVHLYHIFSEALDQRKIVRVVFCDISKAFDRVWHDGLIYKLKRIGITGGLLSWFQNYLSDRYQRVVIDGAASPLGRIEAGVPQGSVLGPLLFLVYINDIVDDIQSNIRLFADDTSVYVIVDEDQLEDGTRMLNSDLEKMESWASQWFVKFSVPKTKSMTISNKSKHDVPPLSMKGDVLSDTTQHKHLGITLNSSLTWSTHITELCNTASRRVDLLSRLRFKLNRTTLDLMYKTFVRPCMEYGCVIWDGCTQADADRLEAVQLRAGRLVSGAVKYTSHSLIYEELGWETLRARRKRFQLLLFHKMFYGDAPEYLNEILPLNVTERTHYALRSALPLNITTIKTRLSSHYNSFLPSVVRHWNELPAAIRSIRDHKSFKNALISMGKSTDFNTRKLFNLGRRRTNVVHARLRMNCSNLKAHLFDMHVITDQQCVCGAPREDTAHYFLECQMYSILRDRLFQTIMNITSVSLGIILYGNSRLTLKENIDIFQAVHEYIEKSNRFNTK